MSNVISLFLTFTRVEYLMAYIKGLYNIKGISKENGGVCDWYLLQQHILVSNAGAAA